MILAAFVGCRAGDPVAKPVGTGSTVITNQPQVVVTVTMEQDLIADNTESEDGGTTGVNGEVVKVEQGVRAVEIAVPVPDYPDHMISTDGYTAVIDPPGPEGPLVVELLEPPSYQARPVELVSVSSGQIGSEEPFQVMPAPLQSVTIEKIDDAPLEHQLFVVMALENTCMRPHERMARLDGDIVDVIVSVKVIERVDCEPIQVLVETVIDMDMELSGGQTYRLMINGTPWSEFEA